MSRINRRLAASRWSSSGVIVLGIEHGLDLEEGQDPVDRVVEEDVEDRDASDAEEKRPRQVLVGFPYLLGHACCVFGIQ